MENEEKKVSCCEGDAKCEHGMSHCCHNWKKCHMMKWIIVIAALIIAFCLGSQWGERNGEWRNARFERGGMMNWGYNQFKGNKPYGANQTTGEVTVDVTQTPATGTTTPVQ